MLIRIWTGDVKLFIFEMKVCDRYPTGQNQKYHHGSAPSLQQAELRSDGGPKDWIWRQSCCQVNSSLHKFIFKDGAPFPSLGACPALRPAWIWGPGRKGPFRRVLGLGHAATKETMIGAVAGNSRDHEGYRPVPSKLADEEFPACVPNIFYSCFLIVILSLERLVEQVRMAPEICMLLGIVRLTKRLSFRSAT